MSKKIDVKRNRTWTKWTPQEDDLIRKSVDNGLRVQEIVPLLPHRSESSIRKRRTVLGCRCPPKCTSYQNLVFVAQIVKFRYAGWSLANIAEVMGIQHISRLSRVVHQAGFTLKISRNTPRGYRKYQYWRGWEDTLLLRKLRQGTHKEQIFKLFRHRSRMSVEKRIHNLTKYWLSDAEQAERCALQKRQLRVW